MQFYQKRRENCVKTHVILKKASFYAWAAANYRCFSTSSIILYNYLLAAFFY